MRGNWETALVNTLRWEGGWRVVDGCPRMKGVSATALSSYRRHEVTDRELMEIRDSEVHAIHRAEHWLAACCDFVPGGVDIALFDTAVAWGTPEAVSILQGTLRMRGGWLEPRRLLGPVNAFVARYGAGSLAGAIISERAYREKSMAGYKKQADEWKRRNGEVAALAQAIAARR